MPTTNDIDSWMKTINSRYENYLKTSFYFRDPHLRTSFQQALEEQGALSKGPFPEPARSFKLGINEIMLTKELFPDYDNLLASLTRRDLYVHQEKAIRTAYSNQNNVVVATGTASGKTESFLYPILFTLYQQYLNSELAEPGVRALILYPMNALANDQRERLGAICKRLKAENSDFAPTFGQYIGQTPENAKDTWRNANTRLKDRLPGELALREEMRTNPPHILLTNYSMLEYLLIRPDDSPLFDGKSSRHWQYIVLDEAHQYRGAKGMEMGMLIRRLKQRLRDGGYDGDFRCIATSATISTGESKQDKQAIAEFASELFDENFSHDNIIFSTKANKADDNLDDVSRYHAFLRALEGAFLVYHNGKDIVKLNREESDSIPLEIALCKECGQHYYVGNNRDGKLEEAMRDPSQSDFGVEYYYPLNQEDELRTHNLCRKCGKISPADLDCQCEAAIPVKECTSSPNNPDQIKRCETCGYSRGGIGDPVQEIVHGTDGPNAVIVTALHELLPSTSRKILAFADSRQEAAFFAWYAEDSYQKLCDRNLLLRSLKSHLEHAEGLSTEDIQNRLLRQWEEYRVFKPSDTNDTKRRKVLTAIFSEALTNEKRLSLAGVGLVNWYVDLPKDFDLPRSMLESPWNCSVEEASALLSYILDQLRLRQALSLPNDPAAPPWQTVFPFAPQATIKGKPLGLKKVFQWGGKYSALITHFLPRFLSGHNRSDEKSESASIELMNNLWKSISQYGSSNEEGILIPSFQNGTFTLNHRWLRIKKSQPNELYICNVCANLTSVNLRRVCPRNKCPGYLSIVDKENLQENHYRILYENNSLPLSLRSEEHTAQIDNDIARQRQDKFKNGEINLLSSSTTFEVGVDLGDLEVVFLRNVPPETFNYTQRVGRAGRRDTPGFALTYCRRNSHDLYHYEDPKKRVMNGKVEPPYLRMSNERIIIRHMVAVVLSGFFKSGNQERFSNVDCLIGDWEKPTLISDIRKFCTENPSIKKALLKIVPDHMHNQVGLLNEQWVDSIIGKDSRFDWVQAEVCTDYLKLSAIEKEHIEQENYKHLRQISNRKDTIAKESSLTFLSRKAVIPKYGFPVDVVELHIPNTGEAKQVSLQRDLSQAIAEYAANSKVVANKKEWESYGIKIIPGKELPVKYYQYDDARNFNQWMENNDARSRKYITPIFGFVSQSFVKPKEPRGRAKRLYTTRPFFQGFSDAEQPSNMGLPFGIKVTQALPGSLVILCEGHKRQGFYICRICGMHTTKRVGKHKSPWNSDCKGTIEKFSLGHELVTDVIKFLFPNVKEQWDGYSLAYAVLLGASDALQIPQTDLNVTITGEPDGEAAVVLYDNVPGGAGLVAQFENQRDLRMMLTEAKERVSGGCGCNLSCYGCLRSYRNQFAHPYLDRQVALEILTTVLS